MSELITTNNTLPMENMEAAAVAAVQRDVAEVQIAAAAAKRFPRDNDKIEAELKRSFSIRQVAERFHYNLPRGGQKVKGTSVKAARELARITGNFSSGYRILKNDHTGCTIRGYAVDLESNSWKTKDDTFELLIQRKNKRTGETEWIRPDERDARELIARRGAFLERNVILESIPAWALYMAEEVAEAALQKASRADLNNGREAAIKRVVDSFATRKVTREQIEKKIGNSLTEMTSEQYAELRKDYAAINDGEMTVQDWLETSAESVADELNSKLQRAKNVQG